MKLIAHDCFERGKDLITRIDCLIVLSTSYFIPFDPISSLHPLCHTVYAFP
jgi:hypothetical protein